MVFKCDERGFELLLTVNHYKYVLKFCNINHSRGQNKADKLAPIPCSSRGKAGLNRKEAEDICGPPLLSCESKKRGQVNKKIKTRGLLFYTVNLVNHFVVVDA